MTKEMSEGDRREYRLVLTDKYFKYIGLYEESLKQTVRQIEEQYSKEQLEQISVALTDIESKI